MAYIYKITAPDGKIYIGSTINYIQRFKGYKSYGNRPNKVSQSIKQFGVQHHTFEVITECDFEDMFILENEYIKHYDAIGLNGLNHVLPRPLKREAKKSYRYEPNEIVEEDSQFLVVRVTPTLKNRLSDFATWDESTIEQFIVKHIILVMDQMTVK